MKEKTISFLHSGDMGDIIASLPTVKEICEREKAKAILYLDTSGGMLINEDEDINKAICIQSNNRGLKFNDAGYEFLAPLLQFQDYIEKVEKYSGPHLCHIDHNLNAFRMAFRDKEISRKTNQNLMYLHQVACGLEFGYKGPWLKVPSIDNGEHYDTVLARTSRYQSAHVFFAAYENRLKKAHFLGTDFEYALWENAFGFRPIRHEVKNALEAAIVISKSDNFLSNGTLFYWIALGIGHKRIVHELGVDVPTTYGKDFPNVMFIRGFHEVRERK